jgi:hypothetical protein
LVAGLVCFFAADFIDFRFDFLPEELVSLFWNVAVVFMYAAFVTAAYLYARGTLPSPTFSQKRELQTAR